MNLIEKLGCYERAKSIANCKSGIVHPTQQLLDALLEYRRANNIYEVGDLIVLLHTNYRSDVFALTKSFKEIYDEKGIVYRHATTEEIKAGHRL